MPVPEGSVAASQQGTSQDVEPLGVFISHRAKQDQEVASTIRDKLRILSHRKIESFLCEKMRGGEDWYEWVENNIAKSRLLLLLYTDDEMDLRWCLYEAGLFRGSRSDNQHLICLKNTNIPKPPNPLQRFQAYNADEEGLNKFLTDLLYRGSFSDGVAINPDLLTDDSAELARAVKDIEFLFGERQIQREYFRKRLEIHVSDSESKDDTHEKREDPKAPNVDGLQLIDAEIEAGELTRDLLGLPNGDLTWRDVYIQLNEKGHRWIHEVNEAVRAVRETKAIGQMLTSFDAGTGRICLPLLSRVEHVKNRPKLLSVIFVETEIIEKEGELADKLGAPEPLLTIVNLLNLARRFRWNILEHFISKLDHPNVQDNELEDLLGDLVESLTRLEKEAEDKGYLRIEAVALALPEIPRETIKNIFGDFYSDRTVLMDAISNRKKEEVVSCLKNLRTVNKKFLLLGLSEYVKRIASLQPVEIKDISDVLQE